MNSGWNKIESIPIATKGKLYLFKIEIDKLPIENLSDFLFSYLTDSEIKRMMKYRFRRDQLCFGIARTAIKMIYAKQLNQKPKSQKIHIEKYGKPNILNKQNLNFNISHSGSIVLLGLTLNHELGVDVEINNHSIDHIELSESVFSSSEQAELKSLSEAKLLEGFYNCWTMKESFIKALGLGLQIPLDQFSVDLFNNNSESNLKEVVWDSTLLKSWTVLNVDIADGYSAAYTCNPENKIVMKINFNQFLKNQFLSSNF